jgi:putative FmdB family regulatory protein
MPLYEYACDPCTHRIEELRRVSDIALPPCPRCGREMRRLIGAPALSFKGSGFYITDYKQTLAETRPDRTS